MRSEYRLPSGECTFDTKLYGRAWKALYEPIEKEFGIYCYGFDPDLAFDDNGFALSIPVRIALRIVELILMQEFSGNIKESTCQTTL